MLRRESRPLIAQLLGGAAALGLCAGAQGQTVLFDFGNDLSFRGASVVNPDENGNTWTSVWSGAFYSDVPDINGNTTSIDFGFTLNNNFGGPSQLATDSFNGPAGATDVVQDPTLSVFDGAALGNLGAEEAVFDYYINAFFQIQGLDAGTAYTIRVYGAHKFNDGGTGNPNFNDVSRYAIFSDDTFQTELDFRTLTVGVFGDHNQDTFAEFTSVMPQPNGIIYMGAFGESGDLGYINALEISGAGPVSFIASPASAVADPGGTLMFTAETNTGDGTAITYQWTRDNQPLTNGGTISGADTDTLTIAGASVEDIGLYRLEVTQSGNTLVSDPVVGAVRESTLAFDLDNDGIVGVADLLFFLDNAE